MYDGFLRSTTAPTPDDLINARMLARLTPGQAAEAVGLNRTAYRRQERGQSRVSLAVYRLLCILGGALPWDTWRGWSAAPDGRLYSPDDQTHGYTAADLYRAHWLSQHQGIWRALEAGLVVPLSERRNGRDNPSPGTIEGGERADHHGADRRAPVHRMDSRASVAVDGDGDSGGVNGGGTAVRPGRCDPGPLAGRAGG